MSQSSITPFPSRASSKASSDFSAFIEAIVGWSFDHEPDSLDDCDSLTISGDEVVYNNGGTQGTPFGGCGFVDTGSQEAEYRS